jgi:hypothetical protein
MGKAADIALAFQNTRKMLWKALAPRRKDIHEFTAMA